MAAVTAERILEHMGGTETVPFAVASGATIYGGAAAVVVKEGYLEDLSTGANIQEARKVVWVADKNDTYNNTPAATTSAGSISGSFVEASIPAGDKTVRQCWVDGYVRCTFTSIAQSDVCKTVYLQNNNTADETQIDGIKFGTLITYISATDGWVALNDFGLKDGTIVARGALTAATTYAGGDCLAWVNPTGETIMIEDMVVDITTKTTGAANAEIGVAANGTTSSSTLMNTIDIGTAAAVFSASIDGGTAGAPYRKMTSTQYITMTPSASAAGMVGTYAIYYRIWE